jgi:hypothetical protein
MIRLNLRRLLLLAVSLVTISTVTADPARSLHPVDLNYLPRAQTAFYTSALTPSRNITLHYAEHGYQAGDHYAGIIHWTLSGPAVVVGDDQGKVISEIACTPEGIKVVFAGKQAYDKALAVWTFPMILVVEGNMGQCSWLDPEEAEYVHHRLIILLRRVNQYHSSTRT